MDEIDLFEDTERVIDNTVQLRSAKKIDTTKNVFDACQERLEYIFTKFERIYISFSGGKDSGVMMNLVIDYMRYVLDKHDDHTFEAIENVVLIIATAILKNDHALASLGYSQPISRWYGVLKKIEIEERMKPTETAKPIKPPKVKPPTEGERIAQLHGLIAGMRDEFDRVKKGLQEIQRRANAALEYKLLDESRTEKISAIGAESEAVRGTVTDLWKIVDGIIEAGVTESEQEIEL